MATVPCDARADRETSNGITSGLGAHPELEGWSRTVDWDDELVAFEIERGVMVSAYALRKLLEARKLADSTAASRVRVESAHRPCP